MSVKGLHKIIYPFAPDQSGAASVLYELGGMVIIVDAGGCAGNVCGFDEPRWLGTKSAVFSAGLRDMDAIMGRDDLMIDKIAKASKKLDAKFIAIVGTPVPATIATDYRALKRMAEKRTGLPVIAMDTNGIAWYDEGIRKAYLELFRTFAPEGSEAAGGEQPAGRDVIPGSVGVLGVTPLDTGMNDASAKIEDIMKTEGAAEVICYGAGKDLDVFRNADRMERNIVIAPAGLAAARRLEERFGTPYECRDILAADAWEAACKKYAEESERDCGNGGNGINGRADLTATLTGKRVLVIHQQIRANTIRDIIRSDLNDPEADITVASWFMMDKSIKEDGDIKIKEESGFIDLVTNGGYDVIIADGSFRKAARGSGSLFIDLPHFAVSGVLN
ncbi:MAG: nitrogenase molybdenum-iron protein [Mogibacterium sp.]|nr:nitrogenase molybdenum-iron protein [Mogibacterium sp.]